MRGRRLFVLFLYECRSNNACSDAHTYAYTYTYTYTHTRSGTPRIIFADNTASC